MRWGGGQVLGAEKQRDFAGAGGSWDAARGTAAEGKLLFVARREFA